MPHKGNVRRFAFSAIVLGLVTTPAEAGPPSATKPADPLAHVRQVAEAGIVRTVGMACSQAEPGGLLGSGAVITPDGYIITSTTVVPAAADEIKVTWTAPRSSRRKSSKAARSWRRHC